MPRSATRSNPSKNGPDPRNLLFAQRLRLAMEERGWSGAETARKVRDQLGDSATFTSANLAHYRNGRSRPRPQYLAALSVVLGKPEEFFLGGFKINGATHKSATHNGVANGHSLTSAPDALPALHIEDRGRNAWLQINQQVPWPVAVRILEALKADHAIREGRNGQNR
jgi:transcriptional regulator with XRE-family HTH domain